ncbi:ubiquitin carboxyl-terminal hydrolase 35 [Cylas formicarius]|uniref:ubiquitin carboxyl-terminal hydrolase 35 n=1 Tax=Cylas formicarius TaxID=197179 RepID=UPI002958D07D|nr:ubiquitin carboxyl-terminal hydrolase 35 [Cylas formicarius]
MAVKQKVVGYVAPSTEARLQIILRVLQDTQLRDGNRNNKYAQIVMALGTVTVPNDPATYMKFIEDIKSVQSILVKECANMEVIFVTLKALYDEICNPTKSPSPVMSIVLQLIDLDSMPGAVKYIMNSGYPEKNLERALYTLCIWLTKWTWTENLGPLVLCYMKGLEAEHHYDILVEVTLATIEPLFKLLILPSSRKCVSPVIHYMLTRMQNNPQAFHKVIPYIPKLVEILEKEDTGRAYLQQLVSLFVALIDLFPGHEDLYEPLQRILHPYCVGIPYKKGINCQPWSDGVNISLSTRSISKVGLNNLGNTCYMNSILQALFMTKTFRNKILLNSRPMMPLTSKLQILFALMQHSKRFAISPKDILLLLRPPGFVVGHQHDSSECLGYLLDTLHEQEKGVPASDITVADEKLDQPATTVTVVQQSFGGKTMTVSRCARCGTKSENVDNFRDLQLSIPNGDENQSVQNLLDYFLQPEKLCGDNQYRCDLCNCLTDGERITKIVEAPARLVLTLKHFRYDAASHTRTKLLQRVKLDNQICLDGAQFDLYAAVVHYGTSVDCGHYYTFAKDDAEWYKFNDCSVTKTSEEDLHCLKPPETPYILFYNREDVTEPNNLPCGSLSPALQSILAKDHSELEQETKRSSVNRTYARKQNRNDQPPPPGCGGGGSNSTAGNMFVC